jgi:hypothetical protein
MQEHQAISNRWPLGQIGKNDEGPSTVSNVGVAGNLCETHQVISNRWPLDQIGENDEEPSTVSNVGGRTTFVKLIICHCGISPDKSPSGCWLMHRTDVDSNTSARKILWDLGMSKRQMVGKISKNGTNAATS